jgi:6-pyruvoyltetrahydropterin/6-carboxytetrahydropterin synthase
MKYAITREIQFDAGHRVPNHKSKCRNPHGHRYRVVARLQGDLHDEAGASDEGMVHDFGDVKDILMEKVHDPLDHGFIVYQNDDQLLDALDGYDWKIIVFPYIPTAENIARWIFEQIHGLFNHSVMLMRVQVWETPTSMAAYPL